MRLSGNAPKCRPCRADGMGRSRPAAQAIALRSVRSSAISCCSSDSKRASVCTSVGRVWFTRFSACSCCKYRATGIVVYTVQQASWHMMCTMPLGSRGSPLARAAAWDTHRASCDTPATTPTCDTHSMLRSVRPAGGYGSTRGQACSVVPAVASQHGMRPNPSERADQHMQLEPACSHGHASRCPLHGHDGTPGVDAHPA